MTEFKTEKGMSYVLKKKHIDCNEKEKKYKIAYTKYLKDRKIKRDPEKYSNYNKKYNKEYYQKHKEKLNKRTKDRQALKKERDKIQAEVK